MEATEPAVPRSARGTLQHPPEIFGRSVLDAPLHVFLPAKEASPSCLLMAGHHGDEPESTALLSAALRSVRPDRLRCAVVLAANPDGLAYGTRGNARGVDLNRNFPASNWRAGPVLHCWFDDEPKSVELSPGSQPASEPETLALLGLLQRLKTRSVISIHSRMACVDDPDESDLGRWLAKETALPLVREIGYPTPGSFGSWARETGLPLITLELPDKSIVDSRKRLGPALEALLQGEAVAPWLITTPRQTSS